MYDEVATKTETTLKAAQGERDPYGLRVLWYYFRCFEAVSFFPYNQDKNERIVEQRSMKTTQSYHLLVANSWARNGFSNEWNRKMWSQKKSQSISREFVSVCSRNQRWTTKNDNIILLLLTSSAKERLIYFRLSLNHYCVRSLLCSHTPFIFLVNFKKKERPFFCWFRASNGEPLTEDRFNVYTLKLLMAPCTITPSVAQPIS